MQVLSKAVKLESYTAYCIHLHIECVFIQFV